VKRSTRRARPSRAADPADAWLDAAGRQPLLTPAEELHLGARIRRWQDWPDGPGGAPPAVRRSGLRARDRMVAANLRFVAHVESKMHGRGPQPGELVDRLQAGALGLMRGAERFDPARGYKFSTFAYWWIRQAITNHALNGGLIRLPHPVAAALVGMRNGRPSPELITAGILASSIRSIDAPVLNGDETTALAEVLPARHQGLEEQEHEAACLRALEAMRRADADGAALLELHHGDGAGVQALAALEGGSAPAMTRRLRQLRERLRALPEVEMISGAWVA
jgi:RNA polymerase sigma factor (sigma-70 family)